MLDYDALSFLVKTIDIELRVPKYMFSFMTTNNLSSSHNTSW